MEDSHVEPDNRRYVDPDMEPGDKGTEPWADDAEEHHDGKRGPLAGGGAKTDAEGAIVGSPADTFDDGDAIGASNEED